MSRPLRPTSSSPWDCSGGVFDWDVALRKLDELNARVEDPTLWDRPSEAQAVSRERANLAAKVEAVQSIERDLKDALEYAELAEMESDEDSLNDARAQLKSLKERAGRAELEALARPLVQRRRPGSPNSLSSIVIWNQTSSRVAGRQPPAPSKAGTMLRVRARASFVAGSA